MWLTRDPISYSGGVNLYGYCESGPVGAMDCWGTDYIKIIGDLKNPDVFGGSILPTIYPMGLGDLDASKKGRAGVLRALIDADDGTDVLFYGHSQSIKPVGTLFHLSTGNTVSDIITPGDIGPQDIDDIMEWLDGIGLRGKGG